MQKWYWHLHHEQLLEKVQEDKTLEDRLDYINLHKNIGEVPLRLHLIRPAILPKRIREKLRRNNLTYMDMWTVNDHWYKKMLGAEDIQEILRLHKEQCDPGCPMSYGYYSILQFKIFVDGRMWYTTFDLRSDFIYDYIKNNPE